MIHSKRKNNAFINQDSISYLDASAPKTMLREAFQQRGSFRKKEEIHNQDTTLDIDINEIEARLRENFQKQISHYEIHQVTIKILPKYKNVRIKNYLSVLIFREATNDLRKMLKKTALR